MKKLFLIISVMLCTVALNAQSTSDETQEKHEENHEQSHYAYAGIVSNFQKKHKETNDFKTMTIGPKMFELAASLSYEDDPEANIIRKLTGLKILSTESNGDVLYNDAVKMLNDKNYYNLMEVSEEQQTLRMFTNKKGKDITEFIMIINEGGDFTMIGIRGNINLKEIAKISNRIKVNGLANIKKLDE
ncbi:MAG: DUF4252 domain-containing protein [Culturomica sp.]|jgi:hypothetical protein|nr:DUF4252 domain-containing protein [Culturomica sp.]